MGYWVIRILAFFRLAWGVKLPAERALAS